MPNPLAFHTYGEYMANLWDQAAQQPDPHTVSRLVAAEACYLQVPDAEAATARPDLAAIDGWAEKIEGTKDFGRMLEDPKLPKRIESRDAESLMTDLHSELTLRSRNAPDAPERTVETQQRRERETPQKKAPEGPTL